MEESTVLVEFVRSAPGSSSGARVTRRQGGCAQVVDEGVPGGELRWLVRLVPALLVAMAPGR